MRTVQRMRTNGKATRVVAAEGAWGVGPVEVRVALIQALIPAVRGRRASVDGSLMLEVRVWGSARGEATGLSPSGRKFAPERPAAQPLARGRPGLGGAMTVQPYPRRFACGMADAFVLGSRIGFAFRWQIVGWVLAAAVLVIAGAVVATGFCVAAWAYVKVRPRR